MVYVDGYCDAFCSFCEEPLYSDKENWPVLTIAYPDGSQRRMDICNGCVEGNYEVPDEIVNALKQESAS